MNTQERLAAMVPPVELAKAYINRSIFGIEDFAVYDWARETKTNLLVKGPTQSAKTLSFRAYGAARRIPVVTVDVGAAMDPAGTLGTHVRDTATGQLVWQDGLLTCAMRNGEACVVLDECNMAHPKVMAAYHPLGDSRRAIYLMDTGEYVRAGHGLLISATMNPDYVGTTPLGQAFSARFMHIPWDYDEGVETKLLAPSVRKLAERLRESDHIHTPVSTHLLMKLQDTIQQMGYTFAINVFMASFAAEEATGLQYAFEAGLDDEIRIQLGGAE